MGKTLGAKIAEVLRARNMTQRELAARLNVSEGVVSRYIAGEREPKPEMLANMATILRTTSDYLLGIEKEEFDQSKICRLIARNATNLTEQEKKELINALFGGI